MFRSKQPQRLINQPGRIFHQLTLHRRALRFHSDYTHLLGLPLEASGPF